MGEKKTNYVYLQPRVITPPHPEHSRPPSERPGRFRLPPPPLPRGDVGVRAEGIIVHVRDAQAVNGAHGPATPQVPLRHLFRPPGLAQCTRALLPDPPDESDAR